MKTIEQVLSEVKQAKPCSKAMLYQYLRRYQCKPIGARKRPQFWPDETAQVIVDHLFGRVVSMTQLRAARAKSTYEQSITQLRAARAKPQEPLNELAK